MIMTSCAGRQCSSWAFGTASAQTASADCYRQRLGTVIPSVAINSKQFGVHQPEQAIATGKTASFLSICSSSVTQVQILHKSDEEAAIRIARPGLTFGTRTPELQRGKPVERDGAMPVFASNDSALEPCLLVCSPSLHHLHEVSSHAPPLANTGIDDMTVKYINIQLVSPRRIFNIHNTHHDSGCVQYSSCP